MRSVSIPPKPRIAVDAMGQGALVLLLHGLGGSRTGWRAVLPRLSTSFFVVAWDGRGQGGSDDFEGPLRFDDLCADILRVLNHFQASRAHLIGQSLGGLIALDFYRRHPASVASLSLVGCSGKSLRKTMTDAELTQWLKFRRSPLVEGKTLGDIAPALADSMLSKDVSPHVRARVIERISANRRESYLKAIDALARFDCELDLTAIKVPTLVIVGEEDRIVDPEQARDTSAKIPGARFEMVEKAGHLVHLERPRLFSDLELSFLSGL